LGRFARIWDSVGGFAAAAGLLARALGQARPREMDVAARLASLPRSAPVARPVTIHWDAHQIPFIEAESEADLAVALGVVHAHLRLAQMEMLRLLSQGRVAEVIGPLGVRLDHALRLFDFPRAVPAIIAGLSEGTLRWAEGFIAGVNAVIAAGKLPREYALLGFRPEPWTLEDLFAAARLAAADVSWLIYGRLLATRAGLKDDEWRALWPVLVASALPAEAEDDAAAAMSAFARQGSNAAVVGGARSRSGAGMLAADPHLSVALPNVWIAASFRAPGLHAAGLMPAGFPIIGIGRNESIAWAGTNLHAASSDLFDASDLPIRERRSVIRVRGGRARSVVLRDSPLGPIVSDGMMLRNRKPLALAWIGHRASDEMGAMLAVMRADGPDEFRAALAGFAVPGLNMLHAGRDGRIGHVLAAWLPLRRPAVPPDLVLGSDGGAAWQETVGAAELPHRTDPAEGFLVSANDPPPKAEVLIGLFFSAADRARRMRRRLGGTGRLGLEELAALQQDVAAEGAPMVRDLLLARIGARQRRVGAVRALASWDGGYAAESEGALVFEVLLASLAARLEKRGRLKGAGAVWTARALLAAEIAAMPEATLRPHMAVAVAEAERARLRYRRWGAVHRMRLAHQLARVPLLGRRFVYEEWAAGGGKETLNKTAHPPVRGRHSVSYGASARFLADLADADANRVVLLGGQDGWLGSDTFLDQASLWREGRYLDLPLRPETARGWPHHTVLMPE
jgi:penicillin G amidase